MDMQNVKNLEIPEGEVKTIHDKDSRLLWGAVGYDTKYAGNTFQQTYSGKNLFDADYYRNATYTSGVYNYTTTNFEGGKTYSFTATLKPEKTAMTGVYIAISDNANPNSASAKMFCLRGGTVWSESATFSAGATLYFQYYPTTTDITQLFDTYEFQLEYGSATDYEPYVGGTASPNPEFPQDVQVVTGEQTISIADGTNVQNFTIDLGSIELAKIGNYQDYIYKSGNDWYVHKETGKYTLESAKVQSAWDLRYRYSKSDIPNSSIPAYSLNLRCEYFTATNNTTGGIGTFYAGESMLNFRYDESGSDIAAFKTWVDSVGLSIYYPLATPTDTKITDSTLISQLNAVHQWLVRYGYNATVTGNLPMIINQTNLT